MSGVEIRNVWLFKTGKDELVLSVNVDGRDIEILRVPMPVDSELSHCVHDNKIKSLVEENNVVKFD